MIEILRSQPKIKNINSTLLNLAHAVTYYLINANTTNFNAVLIPLGKLLNTFRVIISKNDLIPLKSNISDKDILLQLGKVLINADGYNVNLCALLKSLVTYNSKL